MVIFAEPFGAYFLRGHIRMQDACQQAQGFIPQHLVHHGSGQVYLPVALPRESGKRREDDNCPPCRKFGGNVQAQIKPVIRRNFYGLFYSNDLTLTHRRRISNEENEK